MIRWESIRGLLQRLVEHTHSVNNSATDCCRRVGDDTEKIGKGPLPNYG